MIKIKIGNRNLSSYIGLGPRYDKMWSLDEDVCSIHKTHRYLVGFSESFSQNIYKCDACDKALRTAIVKERRAMGRVARKEHKQKSLTMTSISVALKSLYDGD